MASLSLNFLLLSLTLYVVLKDACGVSPQSYETESEETTESPLLSSLRNGDIGRTLSPNYYLIVPGSGEEDNFLFRIVQKNENILRSIDVTENDSTEVEEDKSSVLERKRRAPKRHKSKKGKKGRRNKGNGGNATTTDATVRRKRAPKINIM